MHRALADRSADIHSIPSAVARRGLDAPTLDDLHQDHDDGKHQKDVKESAHRIGGDQPEQPKHHQNYRYCVEH
jgi:hypothetical protein